MTMTMSDTKKFAKDQRKLLDFARKYPDWHSWNKNCGLTNKVVDSLHILGLIKTNEHHQFKYCK